MTSMAVRLKAVLVGVVLSTSFVSAQQPIRPGIDPVINEVSKGRAQQVSADIRSAIHGVALDGDRKPLQKARLRLRNLEVNEVEQNTTSNTRGEFQFVARPEIPYVVEIADSSDRVLAVSDVIVPRLGDVANTSVLLPSQVPAISGIFTQTALSVGAAAASVGLAVMDPTLPKVSPTR
jgi:hypothetical protein